MLIYFIRNSIKDDLSLKKGDEYGSGSVLKCHGSGRMAETNEIIIVFNFAEKKKLTWDPETCPA
jgi:hypothetical protein